MASGRWSAKTRRSLARVFRSLLSTGHWPLATGHDSPTARCSIKRGGPAISRSRRPLGRCSRTGAGGRSDPGACPDRRGKSVSDASHRPDDRSFRRRRPSLRWRGNVMHGACQSRDRFWSGCEPFTREFPVADGPRLDTQYFPWHLRRPGRGSEIRQSDSALRGVQDRADSESTGRHKVQEKVTEWRTRFPTSRAVAFAGNGKRDSA